MEEDAWEIELSNTETGETYEGEFIDMRIQMDTIPSGKFAYNCRHADDGDWVDPVTIEKGDVLVNFSGVFITDKEIIFPEGGDYISVTQSPLCLEAVKAFDYSDHSGDFYDLEGCAEVEDIAALEEHTNFEEVEEEQKTDLNDLFDAKLDYFVRTYLTDIQQISPLSKEEENELVRLLAEKDRKARRRLVEANLQLVVSIARNYIESGTDFAGIIQAGNDGLITAVMKYDNTKGCTFSQYASWWIRRMTAMKANDWSYDDFDDPETKEESNNFEYVNPEFSYDTGSLEGLDSFKGIEDEEPVDLDELAESINDNAVRTYLEEIRKISPMDKGEEAELLKGVAEGDEEAHDILTAVNLRLVVSIAKRYIGCGMAFIDLIQAGNLGLVDAVENYNCPKECGFTQYAAWRINQAINQEIFQQTKPVRVPAGTVEKLNKLLSVKRQLSLEYDREPSPEEIAEEMGISSDEVYEILEMTQNPCSDEMPADDIGESVPCSTEADTSLREHLSAALEWLTAEEKAVLSLRFGLKDGRTHSLQEVSRELNLSIEQIRQIEADAMCHLRNPGSM